MLRSDIEMANACRFGGLKIRLENAALLLVCVALLLCPPPAFSQEVGGAQLGLTSIERIRDIRGDPDTTTLTEDGQHRVLLYGDEVFYFDADSTVDFARVLMTAATRVDIEEVFGEHLLEERDTDLQIVRHYSDTVAVRYDRDGDRVIYIEYAQRDPVLSVLYRLQRMDDSIRDAAAGAETERELVISNICVVMPSA